MADTNQSQMKIHAELSAWDRFGILLSGLCLAHCLLAPLVILSLPLMARSYLVHPLFHIFLAVLILPVGLFAFWRGYRHHGNTWILVLGLPGLALVAVAPIVLDLLRIHGPEAVVVSIGSLLLVAAHWKNQRACACAHSH